VKFNAISNPSWANAHRGNDRLVRCILEFNETRPATIHFSRVSNVRWLRDIKDYEVTRKRSEAGEQIYYFLDFKGPKIFQRTSNICYDSVLTVLHSKLYLRPDALEDGTCLIPARPGDLISGVTGLQRNSIEEMGHFKSSVPHFSRTIPIRLTILSTATVPRGSKEKRD
jgi:hypothetical protein